MGRGSGSSGLLPPVVLVNVLVQVAAELARGGFGRSPRYVGGLARSDHTGGRAVVIDGDGVRRSPLAVV